MAGRARLSGCMHAAKTASRVQGAAASCCTRPCLHCRDHTPPARRCCAAWLQAWRPLRLPLCAGPAVQEPAGARPVCTQPGQGGGGRVCGAGAWRCGGQCCAWRGAARGAPGAARRRPTSGMRVERCALGRPLLNQRGPLPALAWCSSTMHPILLRRRRTSSTVSWTAGSSGTTAPLR